LEEKIDESILQGGQGGERGDFLPDSILQEDWTRTFHHLYALESLHSATNQFGDFSALLHRVVKTAEKLIDCEYVAVLMLTDNNNWLKVVHHPDSEVDGIKIPSNRGTYQMVKEKLIFFIDLCFRFDGICC